MAKKTFVWIIRRKSIKVNYALALLAIAIVFVQLSSTHGRPATKGGRKRMVIHVPVQVKMHHHTHTVYSHIRSGETKQTVYKILGYSPYGKGSHGSSYEEHDHGVMYEHHHQHHPCDEMCDYDEHKQHYNHYHGRNTGYGRHNVEAPPHGHGDMIFNHYSRQDEVVDDYPEIEALIDDIEWE